MTKKQKTAYLYIAILVNKGCKVFAYISSCIWYHWY